ncbi:Response regulator [Gammaproteobacteria bacterium]
MQILVVDDDPLAGEMTAAILEASGHTPLLAENGIEALEMLADTPTIGLIVSDMNMPFVSGHELLLTLREQGTETPFILLSGDDLASPSLLLSDTGPDACLLKDFSLEERLIETIEAILARRSSQNHSKPW